MRTVADASVAETVPTHVPQFLTTEYTFARPLPFLVDVHPHLADESAVGLAEAERPGDRLSIRAAVVVRLFDGHKRCRRPPNCTFGVTSTTKGIKPFACMQRGLIALFPGNKRAVDVRGGTGVRAFELDEHLARRIRRIKREVFYGAAAWCRPVLIAAAASRVGVSWGFGIRHMRYADMRSNRRRWNRRSGRLWDRLL